MMPCRALAFTLLLALAPAWSNHVKAEVLEIHWYKDLAEASEAARKTNQPMLIDFWADWCGPCKVMDAEVYKSPALISAMDAKMVGVRIHFDLQPDLVRKYDVPALPYLVFTDSLGTELMHHRGLIEAADLTAVIQAFPADVAEINRLDRALQEDKNHFPTLRRMGDRLRSIGFYQASSGFFERALQQDESRKDAAAREAILYDLARNSIALMDGKSAAAGLEKCLKDFPSSARRADMLLNLGRAYALDDKKDKARKAFSAAIAEFPASPAAAQARDLLNKL